MSKIINFARAHQLSGVDNNVWEPGAVGVYENIWKCVREVAA